jgi:hypothetical protein
MKRRLFNIITMLSLLLCVATVGLWVGSYLLTTPPFNPKTGEAPRLPGWAVQIPVPGDVDEYAAPLNGRLELWEYTPWDGRYYRNNDGIGLWFSVAMFLVIPAIRFLALHRGRSLTVAV